MKIIILLTNMMLYWWMNSSTDDDVQFFTTTQILALRHFNDRGYRRRRDQVRNFRWTFLLLRIHLKSKSSARIFVKFWFPCQKLYLRSDASVLPMDDASVMLLSRKHSLTHLLYKPLLFVHIGGKTSTMMLYESFRRKPGWRFTAGVKWI